MLNRKSLDVCYLYDGSFDGLLTIVFDCYVQKQIPIAIEPLHTHQDNLLDQTVLIQTDPKKAKRIYNGIVATISFDTLSNAYYAFQAKDAKKERLILQYLLLGFEVGCKVNTMLSISYVFDVLALRKKVFGESHRLKGLIKFRCIGENLYYAPVHPDHNVIETVGHHFIKRLPTQNFILHDKNRNIALAYNTKEYSIFDVPSSFQVPEFTEEEKKYQLLWQTFFKTIAIKERTNPRLQMQYMPKKYWQDLVEMP